MAIRRRLLAGDDPSADYTDVSTQQPQTVPMASTQDVGERIKYGDPGGGGASPPPPATPPTTPPTNPATPPPPPTKPFDYWGTALTPIGGFDTGKLNDTSHVNNKYTNDLRDFSRALTATGATSDAGGMQKVVDWLNQLYAQDPTNHKGQQASFKNDMLDFGNGNTPIDVLIDSGKGGWAFQNGGYGWQNGKGTYDMGPAPSAPRAAPASAGGGTTGGPSGIFQPFGGPESGGVYGDDQLQQVGQDPFSQLLTGGYAALLGTGGAGFNAPNTARAIEAARMPYEIARKSQLANARANLADRGLLSEPGHPQGPEASAIQHIEEGLAPAYTGAIADRLHSLDQLSTDQARTFLDTLQGGTQRQGVLGDLALRSLEQNRLFTQFLAQFGLDRDKALADLASGKSQNLILLLQQWLNANGITANGFIGN